MQPIFKLIQELLGRSSSSKAPLLSQPSVSHVEQNSPSSIERLVQELRKTLKQSTVLTPESEGYAQAIVRWSDAVEKKAAIVVYVGSAEDISQTILLSRRHGVDFCVSGGKHSSGGASSITGGLVIDLAKMRQVLVDEATKTVRVQGGCIWKDVDEAAARYGLAMIGGTVNHTGVGGLTLGGGYGWLSGRYGLTIDNLLRVQMVLGDGTITYASESENPDLFWAVRGAGHCFGVAVEFTFQTYDQKNQIFAGQLIFPARERLDQVVAFANKFVAEADGESGMVMGITQPPFLQSPAIITTIFHNGSEEGGRAIFKELFEIGPLKDTTKVRPYSEMNSVMNHAVDYGGRKISKGASFITPIRPEFVHSMVDDLQKFHKDVPGTTRTIMLFEFFYPEKWMEVSNKDMAYANRGRHQNLMIGPFWNDEKQDNDCRMWGRQMAKKVQAEFNRVRDSEGGEVERVKEYGNYDDLSAKAKDIFGDNFDRLVQIKRKYDRDNVFNKHYQLV